MRSVSIASRDNPDEVPEFRLWHCAASGGRRGDQRPQDRSEAQPVVTRPARMPGRPKACDSADVVFWLIVVRQENRSHRTIRLGDDPEPVLTFTISRKQPAAVKQGGVICQG